MGHGKSRRIESRVPGSDVNPYIALAATIAAGLYGIDHGLELSAPFEGNAYVAPNVSRLPFTLSDAIDCFADSEVALEAFGDDVHHHLLNTARQEWLKANLHVTDW